MSHPASHWALYFAQCPSASARYVLMILGEAHNGTSDRCFPSIDTIVGLSGLSRRTVFACLKQLEEAGLVIRKTLTHENGRQTGVEYELQTQFHTMRHEAPEGLKRKHLQGGGAISAPSSGGAESAPTEGAKSAPQGVRNLHPSKDNRERDNRERNREASSLRSEGTPAKARSGSNVVRLKQKTRLTEAFTLTAERLAKGVAKGLSEEDTRHEFGKFQDHFIGNGVAWVDWDRCWSKWLSTAVERGPRQAAYGGGRPQAATFFHATRQAIARVQAARGPDGRDEVDLPF